MSTGPHAAKNAGKRSHVGGRRAAAAKARGDARIARFIGEAGRAHCIKLVGNER